MPELSTDTSMLSQCGVLIKKDDSSGAKWEAVHCASRQSHACRYGLLGVKITFANNNITDLLNM